MRGTVAELDGDDVLLVIDPKKDVKVRFRRSAVDIVETEEKK